MSAPVEHRVQVADVPLPGGRVLRLSRETAPSGPPRPVHVALGWPEELDGAGAAVSIPADAVPDVQAALAAMVEAEP